MNKISRGNWAIIWVGGITSQICWNIENQWFPVFVYSKIAPNPDIITWMVALSAISTTLCSILIGAWSDRVGKRKPFISIGYILWSIFTIAFGATQFMPKDNMMLLAISVVGADAIMSFFGSVGFDAGYHPWLSDISNEKTRGQIGAAISIQPMVAAVICSLAGGLFLSMDMLFEFFMIIGLLVGVVGVMSLFVVKDSTQLKPNTTERSILSQVISIFKPKNIRKHKQLWSVMMIYLVYFTAGNIFYSYSYNYGLYTLKIDPLLLGGLMVVVYIACAIGTIPAIRYINEKRYFGLFIVAILLASLGLCLYAFNSIVFAAIGLILNGIGGAIVFQILVAWGKNLFPENQRGVYEGLRNIVFVMIPMIIGPSIAAPIVKTFGEAIVINGQAGFTPPSTLFLVSGICTLLTLIPLYYAHKEFKKDEALKLA